MRLQPASPRCKSGRALHLRSTSIRLARWLGLGSSKPQGGVRFPGELPYCPPEDRTRASEQAAEGLRRASRSPSRSTSKARGAENTDRIRPTSNAAGGDESGCWCRHEFFSSLLRSASGFESRRGDHSGVIQGMAAPVKRPPEGSSPSAPTTYHRAWTRRRSPKPAAAVRFRPVVPTQHMTSFASFAPGSARSPVHVSVDPRGDSREISEGTSLENLKMQVRLLPWALTPA